MKKVKYVCLLGMAVMGIIAMTQVEVRSVYMPGEGYGIELPFIGWFVFLAVMAFIYMFLRTLDKDHASKKAAQARREREARQAEANRQHMIDWMKAQD